MNPLSTSRNKYYLKPKNSSIYTPQKVADFLFDLVSPHIDKNKDIIDPSVGSGNLVRKFNDSGYHVIGYDINDDPDRIPIDFKNENFLAETEKNDNVGLVICNPPFNTDIRNKNFLKDNNKGKALLPELFSLKAFELYGATVPLIMFAPMGILFNQRKKSTRWREMRDSYPDITSIITMPLDIFPNVEFHNLILIYNMPLLKPHYFLPECCIDM